MCVLFQTLLEFTTYKKYNNMWMHLCKLWSEGVFCVGFFFLFSFLIIITFSSAKMFLAVFKRFAIKNVIDQMVFRNFIEGTT